MYKNILIMMMSVLCLLTRVAIAGSDDLTLQDYKRFALVIGNGKYEKEPLVHPLQDSRRMKTFLEMREGVLPMPRLLVMQ